MLLTGKKKCFVFNISICLWEENGLVVGNCSNSQHSPLHKQQEESRHCLCIPPLPFPPLLPSSENVVLSLSKLVYQSSWFSFLSCFFCGFTPGTLPHVLICGSFMVCVLRGDTVTLNDGFKCLLSTCKNVAYSPLQAILQSLMQNRRLFP